MKICLINDALPGTGTGRYAFGLYDFLKYKKIKTKMIFLNKKPKNNTTYGVQYLPPLFSNTLSYSINFLFYYPFYLGLKKFDDFDICHFMRHYPAFIPPLKLLQNKKIVVTSLDLCPLTFQKKKCSFIYAKMLKLLNLADRIIAISNSVKNDLIKFANLPEEKIDVIYLGVDKKIFHPIDSKNLNKIVSNDFSRKKMILHVGVDNKRKNIKNLLLAFYKLSKKYKDVELIRVGTPSKESLQLIKILNLQNKVKYLQNCSDTDLNKLYNLCDLFIFPSFCEGFGLPLVEAMACGAPIITSKNSSMPEVVGDAAILIDPKNINDIFRAMDQILSDDSLKEELKRKAYKRSKLFSWEKTFNQTIKVYHSIEKK